MEVKDILLKEMSDTKAINISFPYLLPSLLSAPSALRLQRKLEREGYGEYLRTKQEKERREKAKYRGRGRGAGEGINLPFHGFRELFSFVSPGKKGQLFD